MNQFGNPAGYPVLWYPIQFPWPLSPEGIDESDKFFNLLGKRIGQKGKAATPQG